MNKAIAEIFEAVDNRVRERGGQVLPRGIYSFRVGGIHAVVTPANQDELFDEFPAQRIARAVLVVAEFAQEANKITESTRLTGIAKSEDVAKLAKQKAPELATLLEEAGAKVASADLAEAREVAPVPIEPADAAQSVVDVELRGILRAAGGTGDQIRMVQKEFAICRAVLRQPTGFSEPLIEFARSAWREFNPAAPTATKAAREAAQWREARRMIASAQHAMGKLSSGRSDAFAAAA
jgi:hypothetical protein